MTCTSDRRILGRAALLIIQDGHLAIVQTECAQEGRADEQYRSSKGGGRCCADKSRPARHGQNGACARRAWTFATHVVAGDKSLDNDNDGVHHDCILDICRSALRMGRSSSQMMAPQS